MEPPRHRAGGREPSRGRGRRTGVFVLAVLVLLGAVVGGGAYVYNAYFVTPDFDGEGHGDVTIQVEQGDSGTKIGNELVQRGVIASVEAFVEASEDDSRVRSVQPGYYQLRQEMSAASAVALLLDPASRVGQLEIRGGVQLDDTRAPDGTVAPGVLTLISQATCGKRDGAEHCVSADELRTAMTDTDPAALGVPEWALDAVNAADPKRRLEGLLVPGRYDVPPDTPAVDVLRGLLTTSAARLEASGLVTGAQEIGSTPYEVLTIASLVEKEAITPDMPKVSRVIYNRLGAGRRLELDSMVNYPLDLQALRTTPGGPGASRPVQQLRGDGPAAHPDLRAGPGGDRGGAGPRAGAVVLLRAVPGRRHVLLRRDVRPAHRRTCVRRRPAGPFRSALNNSRRPYSATLRAECVQDRLARGLPEAPARALSGRADGRRSRVAAPVTVSPCGRPVRSRRRRERRTSAPVSTLAGNGSAAARRVSSSTGRCCALPSSTRLPNPRPCRMAGAATTATCAKRARAAATCVRANRSSPPSATLAAYTPPGASTAAAADRNSADVRCAGVRAPAKTSSTSRSAVPGGIRVSAARASPTVTSMPSPSAGSREATRSTSPASTSTTSCEAPGRVAAT